MIAREKKKMDVEKINKKLNLNLIFTVVCGIILMKNLINVTGAYHEKVLRALPERSFGELQEV